VAEKKDHLLIRAARGESVERAPVWAMRQAGRWTRSSTVCAPALVLRVLRDVELASLLLLPRRFGVDAVILFYDITTLPFAMGLPFQLLPQRGRSG